jgi:alpha-mannosidase
VTLYDDLAWVDVENRLDKNPTTSKEALYSAFPFAFTRPAVETEVPLGRMMVDRDQQPGSCRDWFCHVHWVSLRGPTDGVLWSAPDTPLFTLNDIFRGAWRRRIEPDGTIFAYILNNYWHTNFPGSQQGPVTARFRISVLPRGDAAEPVRRGWGACDPLYVSEPYVNPAPGPLVAKDRALTVADPNVLVVGAKRAEIGDGVIVRLLEVGGAARTASIWPAAYAFRHVRRTNLVEVDEGPTSSVTGAAAVELRAWGVASARLFTSREGAG